MPGIGRGARDAPGLLDPLPDPEDLLCRLWWGWRGNWRRRCRHGGRANERRIDRPVSVALYRGHVELVDGGHRRNWRYERRRGDARRSHDSTGRGHPGDDLWGHRRHFNWEGEWMERCGNRPADIRRQRNNKDRKNKHNVDGDRYGPERPSHNPPWLQRSRALKQSKAFNNQHSASTISIQQFLALLDTMPPARFLSGSPWLAWHCTCSRSLQEARHG